MLLFNVFFTFIFSASFAQGYTTTRMWCYNCVSTHPGCGQPFNWLWHWSMQCPETSDRCIKLIEKRGGEEVISRGCTSHFKGYRTDMPADHYEGCRPAAHDKHLGNYVNNSQPELDVYRNYYNNVTWCFCHFDNRCNSAARVSSYCIALAFSLITLRF